MTVGLLAGAMGIQSTTTGRLQVRGFNSAVVLTTMLATLTATSRAAGGSGEDNQRRMLAIFAIFAGGLVGAVLTLHGLALAPLALAALVLAGCALSAHRRAQSVRARSMASRGPSTPAASGG